MKEAKGCMLRCRLGNIICEFLKALFMFVLTACGCGLALALIISLTGVLMAVMTIISVPLLPLLLVLYFTTYLIQLVKRVANHDEVAQFRGGLAFWISMLFNSLTTNFFICMLIFMCSPSLKHRTLHDLPVWKWMAALTIICLFCSYTMNVCYYFGYLLLRKFKGNNDKVHLYEGLMGLINCGLFLLAEFSTVRVAPVFKEPTILGFQVTKWVQVILVVLAGHNAICTVTSFGVIIGLRRGTQSTCSSASAGGKDETLLRRCFSKLVNQLLKIRDICVGAGPGGKKKGNWRKHVVYFAEELRRSVNFFLTSFLFLLTWILYFGSRLDMKTHKVKEAYDYVMWTFVCVFVISFLWLVKNGILLSWIARVVYNRFHDDILKRSTQLWLLGVLGGSKCDILNIWKTKEKKETQTPENTVSTAEQGNSILREIFNIFCGPMMEMIVHIQNDDHEDKSTKKKEAQTPENTDVDSRQRKLDVVIHEKKPEKDGNGDNHEKPEASSSSPPKERDHKTGNKASRQKTMGTSSDISTKSKNKVKKAREVLSAPADYHNVKDVPTHLIMQMASYFLAAEDLLSQKNYVKDFLENWYQNKPAASTRADSNTIERPADLTHSEIKDEDHQRQERPGMTQDEIRQKDEDRLRKQWQGMTHNEIRQKDEDHLREEWQGKSIEKWLDTAHKTNLALARSLSGAKEVVDVLDNLISWLLLGIMIVLWLLFTGIATTKVIVLIASPILAASFIFGDTCKTFFQGIIFIYALHQFNVGDICTIAESTQMEVKRVGIWRTIFSKIGTVDEVVYPNSVLSTMPIVNHKAEVDPNDYAELSLGSSIGKTEIDSLKHRINSYLEKTQKLKRHPLGVLVKELGDPVKLGVHFKHEETEVFGDMLPADALENKTRTRDEFLLEIKSYIDNK